MKAEISTGGTKAPECHGWFRSFIPGLVPRQPSPVQCGQAGAGGGGRRTVLLDVNISPRDARHSFISTSTVNISESQHVPRYLLFSQKILRPYNSADISDDKDSVVRCDVHPYTFPRRPIALIGISMASPASLGLTVKTLPNQQVKSQECSKLELYLFALYLV